MANGWASLGAALAGGGLNRDMAYNKGAMAATTLDAAMLEARKRRDAELGRTAAAHDAFQSGDNELGNAILQGFGTLPGLNTYAEGRQTRSFRDEAMGIARRADADLGELNRMLMVVSGKPVDLTNVKDGVSFNPMVTPDAQSISPTEIGLTEMLANKARANASNASAANSYASAARTRAGISSDKAANYALQATPDGIVRVNKLTGEVLPLVTPSGTAVVPAPSGRGASGSGGAPALPAGERGRLGLLDAGAEALSKYTALAFPDGKTYDRSTRFLGPADAYLNEAINDVLRYESGAAVPDSEVKSALGRYRGSIFNRDETNRALIQQLEDKIATQRDRLLNGAPPSDLLEAVTGQRTASGGLKVGHVEDGHRYIGGDPSDPSSWEPVQ